MRIAKNATATCDRSLESKRVVSFAGDAPKHCRLRLSTEVLEATIFTKELKITITVSVFAAALVLCVAGWSLPADDQSPSAQALLRRVVDQELKAADSDHSHWMYKLEERNEQHKDVKLVIQTKDGALSRLCFVNGKPITRQKEQEESQRIAQLIRNPDELQKLRRDQEEDANQTEKMFKLLPEAFTARYGERRGDLVEILFEPNPQFHPSSHRAQVLHAMKGFLWVNTRENRLTEIEGHLIKTVKFGWGLLGYLDEGGRFHVEQSEVAPGHWEVTLLRVNMHGKALFFKTIGVQQNEIRSDFQKVPENLTLAAAARELQQRSTQNPVGS